MAGGVAVFGAEGGAEGVYVSERKGKNLGVQLAGYGERYGLSEEILVVVDLAVFGLRKSIHIKSGYLEHFACALAVASGDQGRMNVYKASVMEEAVNGLRCDGADAERALEQVCARTQVLDGS